MAKWQAKFKSWESLLKNTADSSAAAQCIAEIKQTIETFKQSQKDARAEISCKVLMLVCRAPNVKAGIELFTSLSGYVYDSYWETFVNAYKYFLSWLIDKRHWNEVNELLPIIDKCPITDKTLKHVFYIYTNIYVSVIVFKPLPETEFKLCCKHICRLLKAAHEIATNEFLDLVNELLAKNKNFQILLMKKWDGADLCFNYIAKLMSDCTNIENVERFNANNCLHCLTVVNVDAKSKTQYTLLFLKAWVMALQASKIESDVANQILTKIYLMIKALRDEDVTNVDGIHALSKIAQILKTLNLGDPWRMYGCVIVSNFLICRYVAFSKSLEKDCIRHLHDSLEVIVTIVEESKSHDELKLCMECSNVAAHLKWGLALLVAINFSKALKFKTADEEIGKLFSKTLDSAVEIYCEPKCTKLKYVMESACIESRNIATSCISGKVYADIAYSMLGTWRNVKFDCTYFRDSQLPYLYKNLLKLKRQYREALEMQCLYIVNMLNNPQSKQSLVLEEIALCCSSYGEAQIDLEANICDILDQAKLENLKIPAYDRKQVKMMQLQATMKYAGIDSQLKTSLARKMIIDADNEIELADIVSTIGSLSFPELESKVNSFIHSLNRKISKKIKDPSLYLALGRLYSRQYKFALERIKKETEGKPFTETSLPDVNLEKLKKYDVCTENAILKMMIAAKQNFEEFVKKADLNADMYDFSQIVDEVSLLARHFTLRGYIDRGYECWLLVYQVAEKFDLKFDKIRAISFFAEHSDIIQHIDDSIDLNCTIDSVSEDLLCTYQELEQYSPRKQNYVLLALVNVAMHLSRQKKFQHGHSLVELVRDARKKMQSRQNCADLISLNLLVFNFKMVSMSCDQVDIAASPSAYFHSIIEELSRMKLITSEDSINLPAFLFGFLNELTAFTLCRLCSSSIRPFLYSVLYYVADFALGFRMAQIVSLLAAIDLQMEHVGNYYSKIAVLDTLLERIPQKIKSHLEKPKSTFSPIDITDMYDLAIEPARRVPLSPKNFQRTPFTISNKIMSTEYLPEHASRHKCSICENPMFRMVSFQVGGFIGRNYYASGDYLLSESCLLQTLNWWRSKLKSSPMLEYLWFDSIFWMLVAYLNTCRQLNLFAKANQIVSEIRDFLRKYGKDSNPSYGHILVEAELYVAEINGRKKSKHLAL